MNIKQFDTLYRSGVYMKTCGGLSKFFQWTHSDAYIKDALSLDSMSIGCLMDIGRATSPSQIVDLIIKDLHIKWTLPNDKCVLYLIWKDRLDDIASQFQLVEKIVIPSHYKGEWSQASAKVAVPPEIAMIDQIARRMHISWDDASKLKWSEVLLMNRIDKQQALFENLISMKNKAATKGK